MRVVTDDPARPDAGLSDLTSKEILKRGYEEDVLGKERYVVQFAVNLTADEEAAVLRRLNAANAVEEELQRLGSLALATDRAFRDNMTAQLVSGADAMIATPTANQANVRSLAQAVKSLTNQVDALSRQNIGLIRLVQRMLDAPD